MLRLLQNAPRPGPCTLAEKAQDDLGGGQLLPDSIQPKLACVQQPIVTGEEDGLVSLAPQEVADASS